MSENGENAQQRRYPPKLVEFVRRLGEAGYRICEAEAAVAKLNIDPVPARSTIRRWLDPDGWEAERMHRRRVNLPGPRPRVKWTWQRKRARLEELAALGLSGRAVALVMNNDFGLRLTADNVRHIAGRTRYDDVAVRTLMEGGKLRRGPRAVGSGHAESGGREA